MGLLSVLIWGFLILACGAVLLSFIGYCVLETDKVKANRYLAELHDRESTK